MSEPATKKLPAIAERNGGDVVRLDRTVQGANLTDAIAEIGVGVQTAIGGMDPDDVSLEIDGSHGDGKSSLRVRLRAYRRAERK